MSKRTKRPTVMVVVLALGVAAGVIFGAGRNVVPNIWLLITEPANVIPTESSLWGFTPTVMNSGSGDWWIYGEDDESYYYFTGSADKPYLTMSKIAALDCAGFNSRDYRTWCIS